ncbi:MAG TPA: hypothetical protein VEV82_09030, partial [Actinomycetota bacterium]|nr:hypothetical protein [Actinomycetota bacterium]
VQRWAREVKDDFDTPDLWAELQRQREIITVSRYADAENTPFTVNERAEIAQQLGQIKDLIRETHSLTEAQMLSLETTFEDAVAAAGRIGRKDWQLLFLGQMFGVIVTRVLPSEAVQDLIVKVVNALGHLFGGWGGPPSLPPMA